MEGQHVPSETGGTHSEDCAATPLSSKRASWILQETPEKSSPPDIPEKSSFQAVCAEKVHPADGKQTQDTTIIATVRRQLEAFELKFSQELSQEVSRVQRQSERLRSAAASRLDARFEALEANHQSLDKRLSEATGSMSALSEEIKNQMHNSNQVDTRAWSSRQKLEDLWLCKFAELEGRCQHVTSMARVSKAGSEEAARGAAQRFAQIDEKIEARVVEAADMRQSVLNIHSRLSKVEEHALFHSIGPVKSLECVPRMESLDAPAGSEPALVGDLERHQSDVQAFIDGLRQECADLRSRIESQEESSKHARALWEARDELLRATRDRVERENWEGRLRDLQARAQRTEQRTHSHDEQIEVLLRKDLERDEAHNKQLALPRPPTPEVKKRSCRFEVAVAAKNEAAKKIEAELCYNRVVELEAQITALWQQLSAKRRPHSRQSPAQAELFDLYAGEQVDAAVQAMEEFAPPRHQNQECRTVKELASTPRQHPELSIVKDVTSPVVQQRKIKAFVHCHNADSPAKELASPIQQHPECSKALLMLEASSSKVPPLPKVNSKLETPSTESPLMLEAPILE